MDNAHSSDQQTTTQAGSAGAGPTRRAVAAAGLGALVVPRHVLGGPGYQAPSDTLTIAAIGVGGMGRIYLRGCENERIVAVCDLDWTRPTTAGVFNKFPSASRYHDYREMFDKEEKKFDALIIAVPDHMHAILLMEAIRRKKDIYCAKPIAHSVAELRKIRRALAANPSLVTKGSVQAFGNDRARNTTELLNTGVIGPVREVHVWSWHPIYPCNLIRPTEAQTPPEGMDWDLWIGPAPYRPYNRAYHPEIWRAWWDFGTGDVGDMACHTFHTYFRELQLEAPKVVYGYKSTRIDVYNTPAPTPETEGYANMVTWSFPARGSLPLMDMYWYDGGIKPHRPRELRHDLQMPREGVLFVGDKGKLLAGYYGGNPYARRWGHTPRNVQLPGIDGGLLLPEDKFKDFKQPPKTMVRSEEDDHYKEWIRSCKARKPSMLPIEFAAEMTETALLGTLALRTERVLEWDSREMRVTNDKEANALIDPPYREGWSLPKV